VLTCSGEPGVEGVKYLCHETRDSVDRTLAIELSATGEVVVAEPQPIRYPWPESLRWLRGGKPLDVSKKPISIIKKPVDIRITIETPLKQQLSVLLESNDIVKDFKGAPALREELKTLDATIQETCQKLAKARDPFRTQHEEIEQLETKPEKTDYIEGELKKLKKSLEDKENKFREKEPEPPYFSLKMIKYRKELPDKIRELGEKRRPVEKGVRAFISKAEKIRTAYEGTGPIHVEDAWGIDVARFTPKMVIRLSVKE
jgi:hypothetical protein